MENEKETKKCCECLADIPKKANKCSRCGSKQKHKYGFRHAFLFGVLVVIVLTILIGTGGDDTVTPRVNTQATAEWSDEDIEYKLAVIERGGFVQYSDKRIDEYASILNRANAKCKEGRTMIADMAVRSTQLLADDGIAATPYEMIEAIVAAVPNELAPMQCSEVLAAVMVLTKNN